MHTVSYFINIWNKNKICQLQKKSLYKKNIKLYKVIKNITPVSQTAMHSIWQETKIIYSQATLESILRYQEQMRATPFLSQGHSCCTTNGRLKIKYDTHTLVTSTVTKQFFYRNHVSSFTFTIFLVVIIIIIG